MVPHRKNNSSSLQRQREITVGHCENHKKHLNAEYGENRVFDFTAGGIYRDNCALQFITSITKIEEI